MSGNDVVMQPRCPYCGAEHYAPAVDAISRGEEPCGSCGKVPPVFATVDAYREARRAGRNFQDRPWADPNHDVLADVQAMARRAREEQDQE